MMKALAMKKGGSILHNKMAEMQRKRVITESNNEKRKWEASTNGLEFWMTYTEDQSNF